MKRKTKEKGFRKSLGVMLLIALTSISLNAWAAPVSISGKVIDANGDPLIGVNVMEVGTENGTITDIDGAFVITAEKNVTLKVTYVGYRTQEVRAHNGMTVMLREDTKLLDEVVVVGYGTQKKSEPDWRRYIGRCFQNVGFQIRDRCGKSIARCRTWFDYYQSKW